MSRHPGDAHLRECVPLVGASAARVPNTGGGGEAGGGTGGGRRGFSGDGL